MENIFQIHCMIHLYEWHIVRQHLFSVVRAQMSNYETKNKFGDNEFSRTHLNYPLLQ